jgi:LysM repeat protein
MPIAQPSPYRLRILGTLSLGVICLLALAARQQGWLKSIPGSGPELAGKPQSRFSRTAEDTPDPMDSDELELPPDRALTGSHERIGLVDGNSRSRNRHVRHGQYTGTGSPRLELDDGFDVDALTDGNSGIANVGFDDDVPPAPTVPDRIEDQPAAVAGRTTDASKAVSTLQPSEARLLDRNKIQKLIDEGNYVDAQQELSRWFWHKPDERAKLLPQLNKMAQALYFSPQPNNYYEPYVVKPGDQLRVVGQRYKLSWEYIVKVNHVDARKIRMGQKLKVVPGPFAAVVFLDRYELVVHLGGSFVKSYRVGVGKDGTTPIGTFTVKNKMVNPTYYGPEGIIPHDDQKNPLGERWIDIGDSYGIHGTIDPESIGKNESRGCIRMLNSEVEEVYDFLVIGSEVKIQK